MSSETPSPVITPIQRLTHRKIILAEERERRMGERFAERFEEESLEVIEAIRQAHPPFLGSTRVEELIGDADPHAFLEEAARVQTLREAAMLGALRERFGDEAEVEIRLCSYDHGWETGERLARVLDKPRCTPSEAFDLLADHFPGGSACGEYAPRLVSEGEGEAVWRVHGSHDQAIWEEAGAPPRLMCSLAAFWCKGFGEGLNPSLDFREDASLADGDPYTEGRYLLEGE
jgi:hypothetical protein